MLKPGLTFGGGLETVWPIRALDEWKLTPEDPFVVNLERSIFLFNHLIGVGALLQTNGTSRHGPNFRDHINEINSFRSYNAATYETIDGRIDSRRLRYTVQEKADPVRLLIREVLMNAIEHGTQNLRHGSAEARWAFGDDGFVFGLEQKPAFRDFEKALGIGNYQVGAGGNSKQRGEGLTMAANSCYPWFWVSQKPHSSEAVILETRGRKI